MVHFHPLQTWFPASRSGLALPAALTPIFPPHVEAWKDLVPGYEECVAFTQMGLPFHVVMEGTHEDEPEPEQIPEALHDGKSVLLLQPHEVMPRLMRLIVALRVAFFGPFCEESSYLFMTEGKGTAGMAAHHDGEVHSFWLQLAGKRTVTVGPQAAEGEAAEPVSAKVGGKGWTTLELAPGALFYLQPRVLHKVVCHERSLALSLTWEQLQPEEILGAWLADASQEAPELLETISPGSAPEAFALQIEQAFKRLARRSRQGTEISRRLHASALSSWGVVAGKPVKGLPGVARRLTAPAHDPSLVWARRPAVLLKEPADGARLVAEDETYPLERADADGLWTDLPSMPCWRSEEWSSVDPAHFEVFKAAGLVADQDLPLLIYPEDVDDLSGWDLRPDTNA